MCILINQMTLQINPTIYHRKNKLKSVNVKSSTYVDSDKVSIKESPKFKMEDNVKMSKYKNIFAKGFLPNWSEEVLVIKKN